MVKNLRSIIHENFPLDLRVELDLVSRRRDLIKDEKPQEILKLLRKYKIDVTPLGPGTNRYAFKINGYVCKVATDHDGKIDNLKEFKMSKRLYPDVTKTYEVSSNGSLLIAEYISPFQSYAEMMKYAEDIRAILTRLSSVYLIGDVGITSKNYVNWGIRIGYDKPVCLDFAYVYDVSSDLFICRECRNNAMLTPNRDFTELFCPSCGKKYLFEDIRARIGNDVHNHEIGDLSEEGYLMYESNVPTELTPERSNYLQRKVDKKKKKQKEEVEVIPDNFELEYPPEYYSNQYNFQGGSDMDRFTQTEVAAKFAHAMVVEATAVPIKISAPAKEDDDQELAFTGKLHDVQYCTAEAIVVPNAKVEVVKKPEAPKAEPKVEEPVEDRVDNPIDAAVNNLKRNESVTVDTEKEDVEPIYNNPDPEESYDDFEQLVDDYDENMDYNVEQVDPQDKDWANDESFIAQFSRALSDISNDVEAYLEDIKLYDSVTDYIITEKIQRDPEFYKEIQNAVFRSLCIYFDLQKFEYPDKNRQSGMRREWKKVNPYPSESAHDSALFLARYYYGGDIHENVELKFREAFAIAWPKAPFGFSHDWMEEFQDRLASKVEIADEGMAIIMDAISSYWCTDETMDSGYDDIESFEPVGEYNEPAEDDDEEYYLDDDYDEEANAQAFTESQTEAVETEQAVADETPTEEENTVIAVAPIIEPVPVVEPTEVEATVEVVPDDDEQEVAFSGTLPEVDDEDDDDEDEDELTNEIIVNTSADGIYEITHEIVEGGDVEHHVRYYIDMNDENRPKYKPVDERNGDWDFLTHTLPDFVFTTNDPTRWINLMYNNRASIKFLILKAETDTTPAIMGIYTEPDLEICDADGELQDMFDYSEDDLELDNEHLRAINEAISSINGTAMDLLPMVLRTEPHPEEDVVEMYKEVVEEHKAVLEDDEDDVVTVEAEAESDQEDINAAAVRALMAGVDVQQPKPDANTSFKPVHRKK